MAMSFSETFRDPARRARMLNSRVLRRFASLLQPKGGAELETMARDAERLTRQNFGRTMRLFAPLYLSNECVNICKYCGFSRDNPILRVTLTVDQVETEARHLWAQGFRNVLLVAGEHPKFVSTDYLAQCVARLSAFIPALGQRPLISMGLGRFRRRASASQSAAPILPARAQFALNRFQPVHRLAAGDQALRILLHGLLLLALAQCAKSFQSEVK